MLTEIVENIENVGPFFAIVWTVTIACTLLRPQKYINSLMLMFALLVTMIFVSGFLPADAGEWFLMICFLLVMLALFLVPAFLVINGVQMIRREGFSAAHALSLLLGIFVGVGELAVIVYVLNLSEFIRIGDMDRGAMFVAFTVFYFSFLVLSFVVYSVFMQILPHRMDFNYVIIHGAGLAGGEKLTKLLTARVDKAVEIYEKCKEKPFLIPSGGQGGDEKVSEAQAMKDYLLTCGIPEEHILLEDGSATTRENLINSKAIIDAREGRKKTALVSSNYHVYRCLRIAKSIGLKCTGIGSKVAFYYWPSALIREFIAVFLTKSFLIWSIIGYLLFISPLLYGMMR